MLNKKIAYLIKLNNKIFRSTQSHLDKELQIYELSSGSYPYLLMLYENEGISQNEISKELDCDKAMSARTITKLIKLGYIYKEENDMDSRAYKLYLTAKAKDIIPKVIEKIHKLIDLITFDLTEEQKVITINSLDKVLNNIKNLNSGIKGE